VGRLTTRVVDLLPGAARRRVRAAMRGRRSGVRSPDMGELRRTEPFSRDWGFDRGGRPVDRYYIERFLASHAAEIRGRTLEVANANYTKRFGTGVEIADVLHVEEGNPEATIVADLADGSTLPADAFDCFILTQTLHSIYDVRAAMRTVHRILAPGGVLLATVPGISQVVHPDFEMWGDYWRFTTLAVERLCTEAGFAPEDLEVRAYGNVLAATALLHGLASRELTPDELETDDGANYQLVITVHARKAMSAATSAVPGG
jgi:SAM-dependent methyltransferase